MRLGEFWRRAAFLIRRNRRLDEMDEELRLHAELRARVLEEQGMTAESAAIAAERRVGNRTRLKEAAWDVWSFGWLESAWLDLRFAVRVLRDNPGLHNAGGFHARRWALEPRPLCSAL